MDHDQLPLFVLNRSNLVFLGGLCIQCVPCMGSKHFVKSHQHMTKTFLSSILIAFVFFRFDSEALAQVIHFRSGDVQVEKTTDLIFKVSEEEVQNGHAHRLVTFEKMPSSEGIAEMNGLGIELLDYIPENTYVAKLPVGVTEETLSGLGIVQLLALKLEYKLSLELQALTFKPGRPNDIQEVFFELFDPNLETLGDFAEMVTRFDTETGLGHAAMPIKDVRRFAGLYDVKYVEAEPPVGEPESDDGRNLHRSNAIDVEYSAGRQFDGSGVNVAVNDDGFVGPHIDFQGRVEQTEVAGDFAGSHGDGVAGVIGAAGNLNPQYRGMAPGARLFIRQYDQEMPGTIELLEDSNVVIFNTSYSNGCNAGYTITTSLMDQQQFDHPGLMQVFSAGNSNGDDCGYGAGDQWGNITGGHKMAKNVIATANLSANDSIASSSSRGPASDGRIKPDISAHGKDQMSNYPDNEYTSFGGTSAASPGVAGVLAQLYQAHREMFLEEAPAALMKCVLLNTANDLGNTGPDFTYGWGKVNAIKALRLLEDGRFSTGTVNSGETISIPVQVPSGVELGKIMVYWADEDATPMAATALINDLDITIEDPSQNVHLPYVLDHTPISSLLSAPATQGVDHLNNMEQVPLFNPIPGTYQLNITGTTVPFGAVTYFVCYEFLSDDVSLTYPLGGEGWEPNTTERVHWDAYGTTDDFEVEISFDNGGNWQNVATVSGEERFVSYEVPINVSSQVKVRVSRGGFSSESDTTFSIIGVPQNLEFSDICLQSPSYNVRLKWDAVDDADSYDVFILGNMYMDSLTNVDTTFADLVFVENEVSWVSVRARNGNGAVGRRAIAIPFGLEEQEVSCVSGCGMDDIGVLSLTNPLWNDFNCIDGNQPVTVVLRNLGADPQSNFEVHYQFGAQTVTETVPVTVPGHGQVSYTFNQLAVAPSAQGMNELKVWTALTTDETSCNDTVYQDIYVGGNLAMMPYSEDFEGNGFPPAGAQVLNSDDLTTWEGIQATGSSGMSTSAIYVNNYSYNSVDNAHDYFRLPVIDIENAVSAKLNFDVAYRPYGSGSYSDSLKVQISTDCGLTFQSLYSKGGFLLSTGGAMTAAFQPEMNEWRTDTVDLSAYVGNRIIVQFVNVNDYGNNLFIDNINVLGSYVGIEEADNFSFEIYPIPATDKVVLSIDFPVSSGLTIDVLDLLGRPVLTESWPAGLRKKELYLNALASGQYLVQLRGESIKSVKKITKL